jgi:hypothetical protein
MNCGNTVVVCVPWLIVDVHVTLTVRIEKCVVVSSVCTCKQKLWKQVIFCVLWFLVCTDNMNCDPDSVIITSPICGVNARQYDYVSWNIFGRCYVILPLAFQCISLYRKHPYTEYDVFMNLDAAFCEHV